MVSPRGPGQSLVPYFELLRLVDVEPSPGRSHCVMEVGPWLAGADTFGIQAAVTGFADCVLSYAATAPRPDDLNVTLGLQVDFWAPPPPVGARLTGSAEVRVQQGSVALVQGQILHGAEVLATASLRTMATPAPGSAEAPPAVAEARPSTPGRGPDPDPDPHEGDPLAELLDLPLATGIRVRAEPAGESGLRVHLVPPPEHERTFGVAHGGAVAALGQLAGAAVLATVAPAGVRPRRLGVTIDYLRPTMVGAPMVAAARVVHRSRRVAITEVVLAGTDGRPTALFSERSLLEAG